MNTEHSKEFNLEGKIREILQQTALEFRRKGILTPIKITEGCTVYDRKEVEQLVGKGGTES